MLSALTTLAFLGIFWLVGVIAIRTLEESGSRIAAALAGPSKGEQVAQIVTFERRQAAPLRREQPLRAAA